MLGDNSTSGGDEMRRSRRSRVIVGGGGDDAAGGGVLSCAPNAPFASPESSLRIMGAAMTGTSNPSELTTSGTVFLDGARGGGGALGSPVGTARKASTFYVSGGGVGNIPPPTSSSSSAAPKLQRRHPSWSGNVPLSSASGGSASVFTNGTADTAAGGGKGKKGGKVAKASMSHYSGRVTTVYLRFLSPCCGNSGGGGSGAVPKGNNAVAMQVLSRCVEFASKHANAHKGALQYMQGCGLMVSFNAASRASAHETKACAFALAVKREMETAGGSTVMHATIVNTNVLSFFAGSRGQLMLTVLGTFMAAHTAMHYYLSQTVGSSANCVIMCQNVSSAVDVHFIVRRLGIVRVFAQVDPLRAMGSSSNQGQTNGNQQLDSSLISQLMDRKEESAADEWMYQLANQHKSNPHSTSNEIVDAAIDGNLDEAFRIIHATFGSSSRRSLTASMMMASAHTTDVVLDRCVVDRVASCIEHGQGFGMTAVATSLW